ncbi:hypothetical protein DUI87_11426 [Hirundo rustica rustica]|uniref:Uncharacterized protein n=1 Tax=Hirundo rustica rustica TaxID=333673 RepID=A0A3M0KW19_HIRRU|nr:hypothetical protein DUI87_11426 [Hirundo rustica rustica]
MGNENSSAENENLLKSFIVRLLRTTQQKAALAKTVLTENCKNTPQDSELGQPPGNDHSLKWSPQKKSREKSGGQDISDPLAAAVPLAESLSPSIPGPTR